MTDYTTDLIDRLATPDQTGLDPALLIPLLRLLASGNPVEVTTLATTAGRTIEETRAQLARDCPIFGVSGISRIFSVSVLLRLACDRRT